MNSMTFKLLALELKMGLRNFSGRISRDRGGWRAGILFVVLGLAFLPLISMLVATGVGGYLTLRLGGQPQAILTADLVFSQVVALVFGFFYIMSAFYFARDLRILLPLPLPSTTIVAAKFLRVMLTEYITMAVIMLPGFIAYGIGSGTLLYWPIALLVFLLSPVLPLALNAVVVVLLMRITAAKRLQPSRDALRVVAALIGIAIFMFTQFGIKHGVSQGIQSPVVHVDPTGSNGFAQFNQANPFAQLFGNVDLVQKIGHYVPPAIWATQAMAAPTSGRGAAGLLGYLAINVGLLALLFALTSRMYLQGLLADEGGRARKAASASEVRAGAGQVRTPIQALFWREITLLVRTPMFLLNAIMPVIVFPVAFLTPVLSSGHLADIQAGLATPGSLWSRLVPPVGMAILLFISSSTPIAGTAISREGRRFWVSRVLPVDPGAQVTAKLAAGMLHAVLLAIVLGGLFVGLLHAPVAATLLAMIGGLAATALAQAAAVMIDLIRPYLAWTDPQAAMKGNINGVFALLAALVEIVLLGGIGVACFFLSPDLMMPLLVVISLAGAYGMHRWAMHMARVRYREIED